MLSTSLCFPACKKQSMQKKHPWWQMWEKVGAMLMTYQGSWLWHRTFELLPFLRWLLISEVLFLLNKLPPILPLSIWCWSSFNSGHKNLEIQCMSSGLWSTLLTIWQGVWHIIGVQTIVGRIYEKNPVLRLRKAISPVCSQRVGKDWGALTLQDGKVCQRWWGGYHSTGRLGNSSAHFRGGWCLGVETSGTSPGTFQAFWQGNSFL